MKIRKEIKMIIPIIIFVSLVVVISLFSSNQANVSNAIKQEVKDSKPFIEIEDSNKTNTILSNNLYFNNYNEYLRKQIIDNNIKYYAKYFNLNVDKAVEIARKLTDDYTKENFIKNNIINESDGSFKSLEASIIYFVRYLYRNPEKYDTSANEIIISNKVNTEKNRVDGHIRLSNGLTYEQFLARVADLYGVNKVLALAIVYEESGKMTSSMFNNKNNMGGLRISGNNYFTFPSLEAGTICYIFTLRNLLNRYNVDSFNKNDIYRFSGIYVHGNINDPADHWTGNVLNYMNNIEKSNVFN